MVSAGVAVAHRPHPDSVRITALSAAIALNLAALLLVLRPMAPQIADVFHAPAQVPQVRWIQAEPLPPPPAIVIPKPQPVVAPRATPKPIKQVEQSPPTLTQVSEESANPVPPVDTTQTLAPPNPVPATAPVETSLAYRTAPLAYPREALTRRLEGTVLLRVLVDETGKPIDVVVEKSSGQLALDRSAHDQVLKKWLFQPAVVQGQHVKAWARVPVTFSLNQL